LRPESKFLWSLRVNLSKPDYAYIQSRYNLPGQSNLEAVYEQSIAAALQGIPEAQIGSFEHVAIEDGGIITINSPFRFAETMQRINDAIASQDDTVDFGIVDFQKQAEEQGTANLTR
jgi:hypothetical protein